jgi:predicted PurR-regulated permease PerM
MNEDMQKEGCAVYGIIIVLLVVISSIVGGTLRTEIAYTPHAQPGTGSWSSFEETWTARHWLCGLVQGKQKSLDDVLAKYQRPGEELGQITITTKVTVGNVLCSLITLGIYTPATVEVHGRIDSAPKNEVSGSSK